MGKKNIAKYLQNLKISIQQISIDIYRCINISLLMTIKDKI